MFDTKEPSDVEKILEKIMTDDIKKAIAEGKLELNISFDKLLQSDDIDGSHYQFKPRITIKPVTV